MPRRKTACCAAAILCLAAAQARADFTLVTVGDLIISRPLSMLQNEGAFPQWKAFEGIRKQLASGDVTYGNLETTIIDTRTFAGAPYSWDGDWMLSSVPAVADDIKTMGITLVSRANNHALDWGLEGMRQTAERANDARLVAAGAGDTLALATRAAVAETPKGKVAIVSMASTFRPTTDALDRDEATAPNGRPGIDGLRLAASSMLDDDSYNQVAAIACSFQTTCPPVPSSLDLFGTAVRRAGAGEAAFTYVYGMNQTDLDRIAGAIRAAKKDGATYLVATIHAHEALTDEAPPKTWQDPAAFLRPLAHRMIDAGADAFVVTGIHHVAGIEIYNGKPIFYGHANFFWSDIQEPLADDLYLSNGNRAILDETFGHPGRVTDSDLGLTLNANGSFATPEAPPSDNRVFQTFLAKSVFDETTRKVKEIRLYPIDLGYGTKLTRSGVPRQASQIIADMVLNRVRALSDPGSVTLTTEREGDYLIGIVKPKTSP